MTDMRLAEKVLARGLNLSAGEPGWEAYHLAKDVLELREALEQVRVYLKNPNVDTVRFARLRVDAALSQQEAGREPQSERDFGPDFHHPPLRGR